MISEKQFKIGETELTVIVPKGINLENLTRISNGELELPKNNKKMTVYFETVRGYKYFEGFFFNSKFYIATDISDERPLAIRLDKAYSITLNGNHLDGDFSDFKDRVTEAIPGCKKRYGHYDTLSKMEDYLRGFKNRHDLPKFLGFKFYPKNLILAIFDTSDSPVFDFYSENPLISFSEIDLANDQMVGYLKSRIENIRIAY